MSLEKDVKNILRNELEASETIQKVVEENDWDEIDEQVVETAGQLVSNANDPERKKTILIITFRIGESIDSQRIVDFAKSHLEEWQEKYT